MDDKQRVSFDKCWAKLATGEAVSFAVLQAAGWTATTLFTSPAVAEVHVVDPPVDGGAGVHVVKLKGTMKKVKSLIKAEIDQRLHQEPSDVIASELDALQGVDKILELTAYTQYTKLEKRTSRVAHGLKLLYDAKLYSIAARIVQELDEISIEERNQIDSNLKVIGVKNGLSDVQFLPIQPGPEAGGIDVEHVEDALEGRAAQPLVQGMGAEPARDPGVAVENQELAGVLVSIEDIKVQQAIAAAKNNNPAGKKASNPLKYTYRQWIAIAKGVARGTSVPVATIIDEIKSSTDMRPYIELALSKDAPGDPAFFEAYATATRESLMYLVKSMESAFGYKLEDSTVAIGMYSTGSKISKVVVVPSQKEMDTRGQGFEKMIAHLDLDIEFVHRLKGGIGSFKHYEHLGGRGKIMAHAEPAAMQHLYNSIVGDPDAIAAPVNVYLYSDLWYCDGCLLEMPQLKLALKARGIDACIIARQGDRDFGRWFAPAPQQEKDAIIKEFKDFLKTAPFINSNGQTMSVLFNAKIDDYFRYLARANAPEYILDFDPLFRLLYDLW